MLRSDLNAGLYGCRLTGKYKNMTHEHKDIWTKDRRNQRPPCMPQLSQ